MQLGAVMTTIAIAMIPHDVHLPSGNAHGRPISAQNADDNADRDSRGRRTMPAVAVRKDEQVRS